MLDFIIPILFSLFLFSAFVCSNFVFRTTNPVFGVLSFLIIILHVVVALVFLEKLFFAFLIAIIYIGAIVVLFLFVTMMLLVRLPRLSSFISNLMFWCPSIFVFITFIYYFFTNFGVSPFFSSEFLPNYIISLTRDFEFVALATSLFTVYLLVTLTLGFLMLTGIIVSINVAFQSRATLGLYRDTIKNISFSGAAAVSCYPIAQLRLTAADSVSQWRLKN